MVDVGMQQEAPPIMKHFGFSGGKFSRNGPQTSSSSSLAGLGTGLAAGRPQRNRVPPAASVAFVVLSDEDEDDDDMATNNEQASSSSWVPAAEDEVDSDDCKITGSRRHVTIIESDDEENEADEDTVRKTWEAANLKKNKSSRDNSDRKHFGNKFGFRQWAPRTDEAEPATGPSRGKAKASLRKKGRRFNHAGEGSNLRRHTGDSPVKKNSSSPRSKTKVPKAEPTASSSKMSEAEEMAAAEEVAAEEMAAASKNAEEIATASKNAAEDLSAASKKAEEMAADVLFHRKTEESLPKTNGLISRESLKESAEFQRADEEEWKRRQAELEKQKLEAQRLRKRKRAEADRRAEMERRQNQRLETIRKNEIQESKNNDIKDQIRGKVIAELEAKAAGCRDLATLLLRLGIEVEGAPYYTVEQVNAAFKRALFRFHPDRFANEPPSRQVDAEETFKLIGQLKKTLVPVAAPRPTGRRR